MAPGFPNWFLMLSFFVFLMCSGGYGIRKKNEQSLQGNHHMQSSHSPSMEASELGFFTLNDLFPGKTMLIHFPRKLDPSSSPHFLSREEASSIPFSLKQLPDILDLFSIPQGSPQAKSMEGTLVQCEQEPIKGERKACVTSLESMLDFVSSVFGLEGNTHFKALTTQLPNSSNSSLFQNYTILEISKEISYEKMVGCHILAYPYAVLYCHSQKSGNKAFKIVLVGEDDGSRVEAAAICHGDTSAWSADHVAFRLAGMRPGMPICHFFSANNVLWVSATTTT